MPGRIPLHITLERKQHAWYVTTCRADVGGGMKPIILPVSHFVSDRGAVNFVKRMIVRTLRQKGRQETSHDIDCFVKRRYGYPPAGLHSPAR